MGRHCFRKVDYREMSFCANVTEKEWNDWHWQIKNSVRDIETLKAVFPSLTAIEEEGVRAALRKFRISVTPYYLSLIDTANPNCPIRLQAIPLMQEALPDPHALLDPLHEDVDSPVPGLTHRYPDRVLLLVTQVCSMYCRHCTRRRLVGDVDHHAPMKDIDLAVKYIREHKEVRDIVISGGDPLLLADEVIDRILAKLAAIDHVEMIRIGSRTPVVMPMRITQKLCSILKKYHPVYLNTHFNSPAEFTQDSARACEMLVDNGIPINNQSVLLKDINDCPHVMKHLVHNLMKIRVRPYYIYQCDLSMGISHFRTPVARGIQIMEALRGHTSGMAVPTFVVDAPGGGGKIPLMPNYLVSMSGEKVILRNFEGNLCGYSQPFDRGDYCGRHPECSDPKFEVHDGPALMMKDDGPVTLQTESQRLARLQSFTGKAKAKGKG
ncbi:MAG: lysine 2,3-aminomutase [Myxococcota bacterium]|jgi:lysine 2,3-aminomutase